MQQRNDTAWKRAAKAWLEASSAMEAAKAKIKALAADESCYGAGVKCLFSAQSNVDYKAIPELQGVDLDQYRKPAYTVCRISAI